MAKKNIVSKNFTTSFFVVFALAFFIGFFFGWLSSNDSLSETQLRFETLDLDLKSFSMALTFEEGFGSFSCDDNLISFMSSNLRDTAVELDELEKEGAIDNSYYELLKKKHNTNQVLFYSYYNQVLDQCENSSDIILFFFDSDDEEMSVEQGLILDDVVGSNGVIVVPMDFGYNDNLKYFYDFYEVDKLPFLVINYNHSLSGISSMDEIGQFLS